jgi:hypothetical protein
MQCDSGWITARATRRTRTCQNASADREQTTTPACRTQLTALATAFWVQIKIYIYSFTPKFFTILKSNLSNESDRKITEAILIKLFNPSLNVKHATDGSHRKPWNLTLPI